MFVFQISYYNAFLVGDQFNCMCANKEAFVNAAAVPEGKCRYLCQNSNYRFVNLHVLTSPLQLTRWILNAFMELFSRRR